MKNYIYFHICTVGQWKTIVAGIYAKIIESGLIDNVEKINVAVLGKDLVGVNKVLDHDKVQIVFHSEDCKLYERPCLGLIRDHSEREDCRILYLHSKGVTRNSACVAAWTEMMIYYLVECYQQCLDQLETNVTCGANLQRYTDNFYYAGNMWWANSSYLRELPAVIGAAYHEPEFWIGRGSAGTMCSLWNSEVDHYCTLYTKNLYQGQIKLHIQNLGQ